LPYSKIKGAFDESFTRMNEKLAPDQRQKLEEFRAAHEDRMKKGRKKPICLDLKAF